MNHILLFNPRSAPTKPRIPNSVLQVAASVEGRYEWTIVDGNREEDPWPRIEAYLNTGRYGYLGVTVMPGPQLQQAIPLTKRVRSLFPEIVIVWGGYFASNQYQIVLDSGNVDYIVNGPGDYAFPALIDSLEAGKLPEGIPNLIWKRGEEVVKSRKGDLPDLDALPRLPYEKLDALYPLRGYLGKTFLGNRTIAYHSSFGCPFTCSFCAVVPIYEARWKGKSAQGIFEDIRLLHERWGGDAIEFMDNNFFVSEKRVAEFARLIQPLGMSWWGEARIDTMDKYTDETLRLMRASGCRMIFFGAESGDDSILKSMDKGGKQNAAQTLAFAARLRQFDIIPEYSFVLGTPAETPEAVMAQIDREIAFIREVKRANPDTEIIIYVYSPVPVEGSELYERVKAAGFSFPTVLEDWLSPHWEKFDLRKNPLTPWLTADMVDKIRNFETVLNGYYPTVSDVKLGNAQRNMMRFVSALRYQTGFYKFPLEIKALQKLWRYRQPEITGFETE